MMQPEVEPKLQQQSQAETRITMTTESAPEKLKRITLELAEVQAEYDAANDRYEALFAEAQYTMASSKAMHAAGGHLGGGGPSTQTVLERVKLAQQQLGREQTKLDAKKEEYIAAGGTFPDAPQHVKRPAPATLDNSIQNRVYNVLSPFKWILGYDV